MIGDGFAAFGCVYLRKPGFVLRQPRSQNQQAANADDQAAWKKPDRHDDRRAGGASAYAYISRPFGCGIGRPSFILIGTPRLVFHYYVTRLLDLVRLSIATLRLY